VGSAIVGLSWVPVWLAVTAGDAGRLLEAKAPHEGGATINWRSLLGQRSLWRGVAVVLSAAPTAAFALLFGAKYMVKTYHLDPLSVAPYLVLPPVLYDVGSIAFGDLASRRAKRGVHGSRDLIAIAAMLTTAVAAVGWAPTPWLGSIAAGIGIAGVSALFTLVTSRALASVQPVEVPVAGGILAASQSLAYIIASPLIGKSVDLTGDYRLAGLVLALWVIPGTLLWLLGADASDTARPQPC
jgi:hypothetical protein